MVRIEKVYADGSGAPATVSAYGHYFAADFIGEVRLTGLFGRSAPRRVIDAARRAYATALRLHPDMSADWYEANRAMYAAEKLLGQDHHGNGE